MTAARRVEPPETPRQARRFDEYSAAAARRGLCRVCAPQHAYGRQYGFRQVHPPCRDCLVVMAAWPTGAAQGWRMWGASVPAESEALADMPGTAQVGAAPLTHHRLGTIPEQRVAGDERAVEVIA